MSNPKPPKRIYIYPLRRSFFSVNEYVNAKQRNIVPPFKLEDDAAILSLKDKIELYRRTTGRDVVAVVKYQDFGCKVVAKKLGVKIE